MERIDANVLKRALDGGRRYLELNSTLLNNLNVFPVPDGDTGVNMVATLRTGIDLATDPSVSSIAEVSDRITGSFSENSRGNSGFIMSQFFAGFFETVRELDYIDAANLFRGFANGSYLARTSMLTPVEGTMITIMAAMVDELERTGSRNIADCLGAALAAARRRIHETPDLLPILAKAGVVDSGGLGFIFCVEGMLLGLLDSNAEPRSEVEEDYRFEPDPNVVVANDDLDHQFCTEFTVRLDGEPKALREVLPTMGSSIALVQTGGELRLHIHTDDPDAVENLIRREGTIVRRKVEDMQDQMSLLRSGAGSDGLTAVLAMVPGEGFANIFRDLGATEIIVYGSTLPSAGEIQEALSRVDAESVILLPNDKNIVPASRLAVQTSDKNALVLPSGDLVQGLSAMYSFVDDQDLASNFRDMSASLQIARQVRFFESARDTTYGAADLKAGEYFTVAGEDVMACGPDPSAVVARTLDQLSLEGRGSVTFFHGSPKGEEIAADLVSSLADRYRPIEFETVFGGQSGSMLIIAIE